MLWWRDVEDQEPVGKASDLQSGSGSTFLPPRILDPFIRPALCSPIVHCNLVGEEHDMYLVTEPTTACSKLDTDIIDGLLEHFDPTFPSSQPLSTMSLPTTNSASDAYR